MSLGLAAGPSRPRATEGLGAAALATLLGGALLWDPVPHAPGEGPSWLLWATCVLLTLPILALWSRRGRDIFDPRFLFVVLFALAHLVKPLVALLYPEEFLTFFAGMLPDDRTDYWRLFNGTMAMMAWGLPALFLGLSWQRGGILGAGLLPRLPARLHRGRTVALAWGFLLVGLAAYAALWAQTGGPAEMFRAADTATVSLGPLLLLLSLAWPAAPVLYGLLLSRRESLRPLVPLLALWLPTLAFFPSRGQFIFLGTAFLILSNAYRRKMGLRHAFMAGIAAVVLSLAVIGVRFQILHAGGGPVLGPVYSAVTAVRTDLLHFDTFVYLVGQHRSGVFTPYGGETLLDLVRYPVPRALWPAKPQYLGTVRMQVDAAGGYRQMATYAFSFLGEWYGNFGFPGVVLGCFAVGLAVGSLSIWYREALRDRRAGNLILYACFGLWVCFSLDRAGFYLAAVNAVTYFAVPLTVGLWACGQKRPATSADGDRSRVAPPDQLGLS